MEEVVCPDLSLIVEDTPLPPPKTDQAVDIEVWAGVGKPKKKFAAPPLDRARWRREFEDRRAAKRWGDAKAVHFVALFEHCHLKVYGQQALELDNSETFAVAVRMAGSVIARLNGNRDLMKEYVCWAWLEEKRRVAWREQNGRPPSRLTAAKLFAPTSPIFTDWLVKRGRTTGRPAR